MSEPFVAGLVLAAGGSRRMGRPKQLLPFAGATLLDLTVATARACDFDQLIVALGGDAVLGEGGEPLALGGQRLGQRVDVGRAQLGELRLHLLEGRAHLRLLGLVELERLLRQGGGAGARLAHHHVHERVGHACGLVGVRQAHGDREPRGLAPQHRKRGPPRRTPKARGPPCSFGRVQKALDRGVPVRVHRRRGCRGSVEHDRGVSRSRPGRRLKRVADVEFEAERLIALAQAEGVHGRAPLKAGLGEVGCNFLNGGAVL